MTAISKGNEDVVAKLVPGGGLGLAYLSDDELLANTRRLVGKTNQLLAALLAHLAEVEARGVHRTRRCASLDTYCIYELRFSEDAAARRSAAARLVKRFPLMFAAIADGELHLTGLLMIGPHLTPENHVEVLGRAKFRTKKELGKLLRDLNPLPRVPDPIEPLGPPQLRALRNPTWEEYVTSLAPRIRELPPGERPRDWANDTALAAEFGSGDADQADDAGSSTVADQPVASRRCGIPGASATTQEERLPVGPVPQDLPPVTGPQHYQVQFCTVEEHAQLVERARALLARSRPDMTLGELHLQAMRLLVASLGKRKFAIKDESQAGPKAKRKAKLPRQSLGEGLGEDQSAAPIPRAGGPATVDSPRQRGESDDRSLAATCRRKIPKRSSLKRSRHIPARERREVYQRDVGRCTYVDERGERCRETRYLELHHLQPFAKGGASVAVNLTLRCAAHNALAAEEDFGTQLIRERRDATKHEAFATQPLVIP